ncbi:MAG: DUF502 domain-containing protein [Planctomycetota bacterium]|jgi:uncharacterized membrane protein
MIMGGMFFRKTFSRGFLVVVPMGIMVMLVSRAVRALGGVLTPLMSRLSLPTFFPVVVAVLMLLSVCFLTGLVLQTRLARRAVERFEREVLGRVPGYSLIKSVSSRAMGATEGTAFAPAMFETDEGLLPAFIVEEHADGSATLFVPAVPTPAVGQIYIVERERVHRVDVPFGTAVRCISKWGVGSGKLLEAMHRNGTGPG